MLNLIIKSIKKTRRLKKVSKKLSEPFKISDFIKNFGKENSLEKHIDELIDISFSDKTNMNVIATFKADRATLKGLYNKLIITGAGQYAKGHFVAASSLVYPLTLKYLLENYDGQNFSINNFDPKNSAMHITYRLIMYFENGETGEVN